MVTAPGDRPCESCGKFGCRCLEEHAEWARGYRWDSAKSTEEESR